MGLHAGSRVLIMIEPARGRAVAVAQNSWCRCVVAACYLLQRASVRAFCVPFAMRCGRCVSQVRCGRDLFGDSCERFCGMISFQATELQNFA